MRERTRRWSVGLGLALVMAALAPAQQQQQQQQPQVPVDPPALETPASLAQARAEAGAKAADLAWLYYSENRIDSDKVYRWSRRAREADLDAAKDQNGRMAASEAHLARMIRLEGKIAKIRRLGFGNSLDVAEVEYYRREAEFWKAAAQGR